MPAYGLIGKPLSHSFSRDYFLEKFIREGIKDAAFNLYELDNVEAIIPLINSIPTLNGLAVTIPYKKSVIPLLSSVHPVAMEIGAVNCIHIRKSEWVGYNTDAEGFRQTLQGYIPSSGNAALVLGTGGASLAVKYVLRYINIPFLEVSRTPSGNQLSYKDLDKAILAMHKLVINTTPLGTFPNVDDCPQIPYEHVGPNHYLYDLVYNPSETLFLKKGKERGASTINGLRMLEIQAEENWKIWNRNV
ncbi:MAG: shikimate dehydrogenase [Ferruginibacter sp.]